MSWKSATVCPERPVKAGPTLQCNWTCHQRPLFWDTTIILGRRGCLSMGFLEPKVLSYTNKWPWFLFCSFSPRTLDPHPEIAVESLITANKMPGLGDRGNPSYAKELEKGKPGQTSKNYYNINKVSVGAFKGLQILKFKYCNSWILSFFYYRSSYFRF